MRVLFIADQFADAHRGQTERHPGGAELTDAAAVEACPWAVDEALAAQLDPARLDDYDLHVVGNLQRAPAGLVDALVRGGRHVLFEHDLRICRWRGNFPAAIEPGHRVGGRCRCALSGPRRLFESALGAIFLTHRQLATYTANPGFAAGRSAVLGTSLMNPEFLRRVERWRVERPAREPVSAVYVSANRSKGTAEAMAYCEARGWTVEPIEGLTPEGVLERFERVERFVFLPTAPDAAGRMVLEARLLGCEVITNGHVGITGEAWWHLDEEAALEVVRDAPHRFWRLVDEMRRQAEASSGTRRPARLARVLAGASAGLGAAASPLAWPLDHRRATARAGAIEVHRPGAGAS